MVTTDPTIHTWERVGVGRDEQIGRVVMWQCNTCGLKRGTAADHPPAVTHISCIDNVVKHVHDE